VLNILVLSLADKEFSGIAEISSPNKQRYAAKHGYEFICADHLIDASRSASWNKVLWIVRSMRVQMPDWIFWTDADSLVMNGEIRLEDIIGDGEHDLIITKDENGLNAGQFLIKNSRWSQEFLSDVWDQEQFISHHWWEQEAIKHVLSEMTEEEELKHVRCVPRNAMNCYHNPYRSDWTDGDFIVHFAGMGRERGRLHELMLEWQAKAF
jgi:hypothetical protein